jgi:hypothetical protein
VPGAEVEGKEIVESFRHLPILQALTPDSDLNFFELAVDTSQIVKLTIHSLTEI